MHVTLVHIQVKPKHITEFVAATKENHEASIQEAGNRRFDLLQSADQPNHFILYEAYSSKEEAALHKQTEHYLKWRDTVADWMIRPREGVSYYGIFPAQ